MNMRLAFELYCANAKILKPYNSNHPIKIKPLLHNLLFLVFLTKKVNWSDIFYYFCAMLSQQTNLNFTD
jgi:hypothetical protein